MDGPPSESQILSTYLLTPSSLPTILPLEQFRNYFPAKFRSHPQIKALYRDLQFIRSLDIDVVRENIAVEVRKGDRMRVDMWRTWLAGQRDAAAAAAAAAATENGGGQDVTDQQGTVKSPEGVSEQVEMQVDTVLFGPQGSTSTRHNIPVQKQTYHTLDSLLQEMERSEELLEAETTAAEREAEVLLQEIKETIGSLSDLRYGAFARSSGSGGGGGDEVTDEIKTAAKMLEEACEE